MAVCSRSLLQATKIEDNPHELLGIFYKKGYKEKIYDDLTSTGTISSTWFFN